MCENYKLFIKFLKMLTFIFWTKKYFQWGTISDNYLSFRVYYEYIKIEMIKQQNKNRKPTKHHCKINNSSVRTESKI